MKNDDDEKKRLLQDKLFDEICEFLRQLKWPMEVISKRVIRTSFCGEFGNSEVIIHISERDICMVIDPVLDCPKSSWGEAVNSLVTAMGEEIRHVVIGLDADGDLFVKVHLPAMHVNMERFQCLLLGLCQVADNIVVPVLQANAFDNLRNQL